MPKATPTQPAVRTEIEVELSREIGAANYAIRQWVTSGATLDEKFWADTEALLRRRLRPALRKAFLATWDVIVASGLNTVGDMADEWADRRSQFSAGQMTATWRRHVESAQPTAEAKASPYGDDLIPMEKKKKSQKIIQKLAGPKKAAMTAKNEVTATISKAIMKAAMKKLGMLTEDGKVDDAPVLVWHLEVKHLVAEHCEFCPLMHHVGPKTWKKFVPGRPAVALGLRVRSAGLPVRLCAQAATGGRLGRLGRR